MNQQLINSKLWVTAGCLLGLTLSTAAMAAKIYKWKDSQGVTHFSETQPLDQKAIELSPNAIPYIQSNPQTKTADSQPPATIQENPVPINPAAPQLVAPTPPVAGTPPVTSAVPAAETPVAADARRQKATAEDCQKAQDELTLLTTRSRIHDQTPGANNKILSPQEQSDRATQMKAWISEHC